MGTTYEIGAFRLDPEAKALTYDGAPVALGPRAVAVLTALVESAPDYVTKARLIDEVWPGVVVVDANLSVQMSAIRQALSRAPGGDRWIETLARRGYRFVGPVARLSRQTPREDSSTSPRSNLPAQITSFVGRERDLAELQALLTQHRLLTLIGSGGVGKTRLALRVAAAALAGYGDGVWLVELAALFDPDLVPQAVAAAIGIKDWPGKSLTEQLAEQLRTRRLLLVLDNAEHLVAACGGLTATLLRRCPQVTVLVTSRERLGISGELTYRVPSLSMPDAGTDATAQSVAQCESAQLFTERVRLQRPHFAVSDQDAPALASICQRLDGIPLAIELAAARVRSMSIEELNERLDRGFRLLTANSPSVLARHRTLGALIDWSYDLLSKDEQAMLGRLSVFAGGCTLEAAEQVCSGEGVDREAVLDLLTSLADKSLLVAEERGGATRYRLLETVRQYARDRLPEHGGEAHWRDRHLAYFLVLAEQSESLLRGADQQLGIERLETEYDNLRRALEWAQDTEPHAGLQLAGALWWFWQVHGRPGEGRRWLAELLAAAPKERASVVRAKALRGAGELVRQQGELATAETLLRESLAMWRELGDQRGISLTLGSLGTLALNRGRYSEARELEEESLAIHRRLGNRLSIAARLNNLALVALGEGDPATAQTRGEESLAIYRELGNRWGIGNALDSLGEMALSQGDFRGATALFEQSVAMARELRDPRSIASALTGLGRVACAERAYPRASALLKEALVLRRELGDVRSIAGSLEAFAALALAKGLFERAARIGGRAERLREEIGSEQLPDSRSASADAKGKAWQEGRSMAIEQIIDYALSDDGR